MTDNKILLEIANFCETCPSHELCPEEECVLYRIEEIILLKDNKASDLIKTTCCD